LVYFFIISLLFTTSVFGSELKLSQLEIFNSYNGRDFDGFATDLSSKVWNNSKFYEPKNIQLSGTIGLIKFDTNQSSEVILNFDLGKTSNALNARPYFGLGYATIFELSEYNFIKIEIQNLISLKGKIREQPCVDDFLREFHCGTTLPWAEYEKIKEHYNELPRIISLVFTRYF